jgi:hypothetical protein
MAKENPNGQTAEAAPPAPAEAAKAPAPPAAKISASKIGLPIELGRVKVLQASAADYGNVFGAHVLAGTTIEHVCEPAFWSNVAADRFLVGERRMPAVNSTIKVFCDDSSFYAELLIRSVPSQPGQPPRSAIVEPLVFKRLGKIDETLAAAEHEIVHKGGHLKFCVVRKSDQVVMHQGYDTFEQAEARLRRSVA